MTEEQWKELDSKLDAILRLLALQIIDERTRQDQISILHKAGLPPRRIADIIGTTANTVSVTLSKMRSTKC